MENFQKNSHVYTWESYKEEQIVVFLDLLGFSRATDRKEAVDVSIGKIEDYNTILNQKIDHNKRHPISSYLQELQRVAEQSYITTFNNFIVGSDSVIITSLKENANIFVPQLCHFLYNSYNLHADVFEKNSNREDATIGNIIGLSPTFQLVSYKYKYSPCLFRGGCVVGKAITTNQTRIVDNVAAKDSRNIIGEAVTRAVKMESWLVGPRVLCDKTLYELCDEDIQEHYFRQIPNDEIKLNAKKTKRKIYGDDILYEILWMTPMFVNENINGQYIVKDVTMSPICKKLNGAYNLLSSKCNNGEEKQYIAFINLIRDSSLIFWENNNIILSGIDDWIKNKPNLILKNDRVILRETKWWYNSPIIEKIITFIHNCFSYSHCVLHL